MERRFACKRIVTPAERRADPAADRHMRAHSCVIRRKAHSIRLYIELRRAFTETFGARFGIFITVGKRACGFKHKARGALYFPPCFTRVYAILHGGFICILNCLKACGRQLAYTENQTDGGSADNELEQYKTRSGIAALFAFCIRLSIEPHLRAVFFARHASVFRVHTSAPKIDII